MLICEGANNGVRWQAGERLHHLFEQRCDELSAAGKPDHPAVITDEGATSYLELDARANQLAHYLIAQGIKPGARIGVLFDKTIERYVALLAVLKINAAYVPLDAGFPKDRIGFILQDAGASAALTMSDLKDKLSDFSRTTLCLDDAADEISAQAPGRLTGNDALPAPDELCYIIYTSGTTGKPKGVPINQASICNFVRVAADVYGIDETDRSYQGMTIAFDFSVEELWVPLLAGATLIPGKPGAALVGDDLADFLAEHKISYLCVVPTLLATIERDLPDVKILLVSGEACPQNLVRRWHKPDRVILNAYGPTEATVTCTLTELYPDKPVTIGMPLPSYTIVILQEDAAEEVEDGETGEIAIAGVGLAEGYLGRPELTAQKFIADFLDLPNNTSGRIYRSGDLGRINEDGEVEFLGRIDTQVKIRGYRIELTEIESVLMQIPQIAQAVVDTHEVDAGTPELVAYYSLKPNAKDVSIKDISDALKNNLPPYMVPSYIEYMPVIPMTASDKADRKNLPAPTGQRFIAQTEYVAPHSATQELLCNSVGAVMKLDRISIRDDFFKDLGAHSLLMAQLGSKLRQIEHLPNISMRDIYLNPSVEKLSAHLDELATQEKLGDSGSGRSSQAPVPPRSYDQPHIPARFDYIMCGAWQALAMALYVMGILWLLVTGFKWSYGAISGDWLDLYLRIVVVATLFVVFFSALPIAAKWLIIGKWKQKKIPIWSVEYFLFWLVKSLIRQSPMAAFAGGPLYNLYLRLLGAKIGRHTVLTPGAVPICTDLLSIGSGTLVRKDALLSGYTAQSGYIYTGLITIGDNAFVGEASVVDIDTSIGNDGQLGQCSALNSGQHIPAGETYHGTPAQPTATDYCKIEPMTCSSLRRWSYELIQFALSIFVLSPAFIGVVYALLPLANQYLTAGQGLTATSNLDIASLAWRAAPLSVAAYIFGILLSVIPVLVVPRLLNRLLKPGKTYVLFGVHHFIQNMVSSLSNSIFFNLLFGDSALIVHYLKAIGYKLNKIVQTGANFGLEQRHDNPFLCDIGSGTMVSDGLTMINRQMSSSSFRLNRVKIGKTNFFGNNIYLPFDSKAGDNCLLATKVLVPIDGPMRENIGLLGSPSFEIPRTTLRDKNTASALGDGERRDAIARKTSYNIATMTLFLFINWLYGFVIILLGYMAAQAYLINGFSTVLHFAVQTTGFTIVYFTFTEWLGLGFKPLRPRVVSMYDPYFWSHERHWKLSGTPLPLLFIGTPFKNLISRMLGVKLGKMVFDDGGSFYEKTLISVGDYTTINLGAVLHGHSLEEGVFKSDHVVVGANCTLAPLSYVDYGAVVGDNAMLGPNAFIMKGERIAHNEIWQGNPAQVAGRVDGPPKQAALTTGDDAKPTSKPKPTAIKISVID